MFFKVKKNCQYLTRMLNFFILLGKDGSGGSDDNESVINDNMSVISNASADSYMKDFEGRYLLCNYITCHFLRTDINY